MSDHLTSEIEWDREAVSVLTRGVTLGKINDVVSAALQRAYRDGKARGEERGYRKGLAFSDAVTQAADAWVEADERYDRVLNPGRVPRDAGHGHNDGAQARDNLVTAHTALAAAVKARREARTT